MPKRLVLLTGEVEAPHLTTMLRRHNSELDIVWVEDAPSLAAVCEESTDGCRLIAVLTSFIVPASLLARLDGPAYNFHPGPPAYPGSAVAGFAIYDGAATFGVTLHEMAPLVDSGPIIEVRRFPVPDAVKFQELEMMAFKAVFEMFSDHAQHFATDDTPLPRAEGETWAERARTIAEARRLKRVEADLSEEEIYRRYRAFG